MEVGPPRLGTGRKDRPARQMKEQEGMFLWQTNICRGGHPETGMRLPQGTLLHPKGDNGHLWGGGDVGLAFYTKKTFFLASWKQRSTEAVT